LEQTDNVTIHECIVEAHQQKHIGDKLYHYLITQSESVNIELLWEIIDHYKSAILKCREKNIEIEAECLSKIGTIYEKILGMKEQARVCHYNCLELVESMKPKTFTTYVWYIKCIEAVKRYQQEVIEKEECDRQEKRKTVMGKIEADIKIIKENFTKSKTEFIKFVYEKYPPKKKEQKLDSNLLNTDLKKAFKTALTHYHTDKNSEDTYGLEWYFICEEISKLLS